MTSRYFRLFAILTAAGLPAGAAWASGGYGPRITVGDVYQQSSSLTSLDGTHPANCSNNTSCHILFQPAPGQKKFIIEQVTCEIAVSPAVNVVVARLDSNTVVHSASMIPVQTASTATVISQSVLFPLAAGERPQILVGFSAGTTTFPLCTVSGHLLP